MGKENPGKKTRGRYEVLKADPDKPRSRKNVATVKQDPKDKGQLGTRKLTGKNVANVVGRSAKTGQVRSRPTNLKKFPKPKPVIRPTPLGIAAALAPVAYEQTTEQQFAGSDSMGKTIATRMKDTVRDIEGTPAEERKRGDEVAKRKMGGKVNSKFYKHGGKLGCGAAIKGYGKGPYKKKGM